LEEKSELPILELRGEEEGKGFRPFRASNRPSLFFRRCHVRMEIEIRRKRN
jgi:hypothetical protein